MLRKLITIAATAVVSVGLMCVSGCETQAQTGALVGGLGGTAIGSLAGGHHGGEGALIGGAVGAAGGYMVGNEMDKQRMNQQMYATQEAANTVVVNVQNSNGSVIPVYLYRRGSVYIGPKGEEYMSLPTPEQLRPLYGW